MELFEMVRTITTGAIGIIVAGALALVSLLSMTASTWAQDAERPYPKMLPLAQYLMDRNAAIALARSAAPEGISKDASVLVLTPKGWETAVKGTNGFVCMAGPSWTASIDFYDVWSPKQRGAICLDPAAEREMFSLTCAPKRAMKIPQLRRLKNDGDPRHSQERWSL